MRERRVENNSQVRSSKDGLDTVNQDERTGEEGQSERNSLNSIILWEFTRQWDAQKEELSGQLKCLTVRAQSQVRRDKDGGRPLLAPKPQEHDWPACSDRRRAVSARRGWALFGGLRGERGGSRSRKGRLLFERSLVAERREEILGRLSEKEDEGRCFVPLFYTKEVSTKFAKDICIENCVFGDIVGSLETQQLIHLLLLIAGNYTQTPKSQRCLLGFPHCVRWVQPQVGLRSAAFSERKSGLENPSHGLTHRMNKIN